MKLRSLSVLRALLVLALPTITSAAEVETWLLFSPDHQDSVMTVAPVEKDVLVKQGWKVDTVGAVQSDPTHGGALLHRLIRSNQAGVVRMLESDEIQLPKWRKAGYTEEAVLGRVSASGGEDMIAIVQFTKGERRIWLADPVDLKLAEKDGWHRQGVQFWLWPLGKASHLTSANKTP